MRLLLLLVSGALGSTLEEKDNNNDLAFYVVAGLLLLCLCLVLCALGAYCQEQLKKISRYQQTVARLRHKLRTTPVPQTTMDYRATTHATEPQQEAQPSPARQISVGTLLNKLNLVITPNTISSKSNPISEERLAAGLDLEAGYLAKGCADLEPDVWTDWPMEHRRLTASERLHVLHKQARQALQTPKYYTSKRQIYAQRWVEMENFRRPTSNDEKSETSL